jgi:putative transposase
VNIIPKSIQLIAGRTGREYNQRKSRKGAFWKDRYHATAVKTGKHLIRCLAYIDWNMVRAGVVQHPGEWMYGGYHEIQNPKRRYSLINRQKLTALLGIKDNDQLSEYHCNWVEEILRNGSNQRDSKWTEAIAVGDKEFVMETKAKLGAKAMGRRELENNEGYELKEQQRPYSPVFDPKKCNLRPKNDYIWQID